MSDKKEEKRQASKDFKKNLETQMEQLEAEQMRERFRRRVEIARTGMSAIKQGKIVEAIKAFNTYIKVLEDWKKVPEGGLSPAAFDLKTEMPEILLLTGVYWDMVTIFDQTTSAEKMADFVTCLDRYIVFARGMPHQNLASETIRKYATTKSAKHKKELKAAHAQIATSGCFIATAVCFELAPGTYEALQHIRELKLKKTAWGRLCVSIYEWLSPPLSKMLIKAPEPVSRYVARLLDLIAARFGPRLSNYVGTSHLD